MAEQAVFRFLRRILGKFVLDILDFIEIHDDLRSDGSPREHFFETYIFPALKPIQLEAGDRLSITLDNAADLFIIECGELRVASRTGANGEARKDLKAGSIFGEMGVLFGLTRINEAVCLEPSKLWTLSRANFRSIFLQESSRNYSASKEKLKTIKSFMRMKDIANLTFPQLQMVVEGFQRMSCERGHKLLVERQCSNRVMLIEKGYIDVEVPDGGPTIETVPNDEQFKERVLKELGVLGSVLRPRKASIISSDDSRDYDGSGDELDLESAASSPTAPSSMEAVFGRTRSSGQSSSSNSKRSSRANLSAMAESAMKPPGKLLRFGEGTIIGTGVLASKLRQLGSWPWDKDIINGVMTEGAVSPVTISVVSRRVEVTYITVDIVDSLLALASPADNPEPPVSPRNMQKSLSRTRSLNSLAIPELPTDAVRNAFGNSDEGDKEGTEGKSSSADGNGNTNSEAVYDACTNGFSMESFDSWEFKTPFTLGSVLKCRKNRKEGIPNASNVSTARDDGSPRKRSPTSYVLKVYSKAVVSRKRKENVPLVEAEILAMLKHQFVVRLDGRFQTPDDLNLVLENASCAGATADLWGLIHSNVRGFVRTRTVPGRRESFMSLEAIRFYAASIILALAHIHRRDIAYRNLRPENVLIDSKGYVRLISFGNAKEVPFINAHGMQQSKTSTICGCPEYMAPEVAAGAGYDKSVDVWALGILMHEMLTGETPFARFGQVFTGREKQWLPDADLRILAKLSLQYKKGVHVAIPRQFRGDEDISEGGIEIMARFLCMKPKDRPQLAAAKGSSLEKREIQDCEFFYHTEWKNLREKKVAPPFIPPPEGMEIVTSHPSNEYMNVQSPPVIYRYDDVEDPEEMSFAVETITKMVDSSFIAQAVQTRLRLRNRGEKFYDPAANQEAMFSGATTKVNLVENKVLSKIKRTAGSMSLADTIDAGSPQRPIITPDSSGSDHELGRFSGMTTNESSRRTSVLPSNAATAVDRDLSSLAESSSRVSSAEHRPRPPSTDSERDRGTPPASLKYGRMRSDSSPHGSSGSSRVTTPNGPGASRSSSRPGSRPESRPNSNNSSRRPQGSLEGGYDDEFTGGLSLSRVPSPQGQRPSPGSSGNSQLAAYLSVNAASIEKSVNARGQARTSSPRVDDEFVSMFQGGGKISSATTTPRSPLACLPRQDDEAIGLPIGESRPSSPSGNPTPRAPNSGRLPQLGSFKVPSVKVVDASLPSIFGGQSVASEKAASASLSSSSKGGAMRGSRPSSFNLAGTIEETSSDKPIKAVQLSQFQQPLDSPVRSSMKTVSSVMIQDFDDDDEMELSSIPLFPSQPPTQRQSRASTPTNIGRDIRKGGSANELAGLLSLPSVGKRIGAATAATPVPVISANDLVMTHNLNATKNGVSATVAASALATATATAVAEAKIPVPLLVIKPPSEKSPLTPNRRSASLLSAMIEDNISPKSNNNGANNINGNSNSSRSRPASPKRDEEVVAYMASMQDQEGSRQGTPVEPPADRSKGRAPIRRQIPAVKDLKCLSSDALSAAVDNDSGGTTAESNGNTRPPSAASSDNTSARDPAPVGGGIDPRKLHPALGDLAALGLGVAAGTGRYGSILITQKNVDGDNTSSLRTTASDHEGTKKTSTGAGTASSVASNAPTYPHEKYAGAQAVFVRFGGYTPYFSKSELTKASQK